MAFDCTMRHAVVPLLVLAAAAILYVGWAGDTDDESPRASTSADGRDRRPDEEPSPPVLEGLGRESPPPRDTAGTVETAVLEGILQDPHGRPVPRVAVAWRAESATGRFTYDLVRTDAQGRFAMRRVRRVPGTVYLASRKWLFEPVRGVVPGTRTLRLVAGLPPVLVARLPTPSGMATPPSLRVAILGAGKTHGTATLAPDAGGDIRLPLPLHRTVHVVFAPEGGARVLRGPYTGRPGDVHDAGDILYRPGRRIEGRVVDAQSRGIGGVQVTAAFPGLPEALWTECVPVDTTADDGRFVLEGVHEGPAVLRIHHVRRTASPLEVGDPAGTVLIRAVRGAYVFASMGGNRGPVRFTPLDPDLDDARVFSPDHYGRIHAGPLVPGRYRVTSARLRNEPRDPADPHDMSRDAEDAPEPELDVLDLAEGEMREVCWKLP